MSDYIKSPTFNFNFTLPSTPSVSNASEASSTNVGVTAAANPHGMPTADTQEPAPVNNIAFPSTSSASSTNTAPVQNYHFSFSFNFPTSSSTASSNGPSAVTPQTERSNRPHRNINHFTDVSPYDAFSRICPSRILSRSAIYPNWVAFSPYNDNYYRPQPILDPNTSTGINSRPFVSNQGPNVSSHYNQTPHPQTSHPLHQFHPQPGRANPFNMPPSSSTYNVIDQPFTSKKPQTGSSQSFLTAHPSTSHPLHQFHPQPGRANPFNMPPATVTFNAPSTSNNNVIDQPFTSKKTQTGSSQSFPTPHPQTSHPLHQFHPHPQPGRANPFNMPPAIVTFNAPSTSNCKVIGQPLINYRHAKKPKPLDVTMKSPAPFTPISSSTGNSNNASNISNAPPNSSFQFNPIVHPPGTHSPSKKAKPIGKRSNTSTGTFNDASLQYNPTAQSTTSDPCHSQSNKSKPLNIPTTTSATLPSSSNGNSNNPWNKSNQTQNGPSNFTPIGNYVNDIFFFKPIHNASTINNSTAPYEMRYPRLENPFDLPSPFSQVTSNLSNDFNRLSTGINPATSSDWNTALNPLPQSRYANPLDVPLPANFQPIGSVIKYKPKTVPILSERYDNITCMKDYDYYSNEELRHQDYQSDRKGKQKDVLTLLKERGVHSGGIRFGGNSGESFPCLAAVPSPPIQEPQLISNNGNIEIKPSEETTETATDPKESSSLKHSIVPDFEFRPLNQIGITPNGTNDTTATEAVPKQSSSSKHSIAPDCLNETEDSSNGASNTAETEIVTEPRNFESLEDQSVSNDPPILNVNEDAENVPAPGCRRVRVGSDYFIIVPSQSLTQTAEPSGEKTLVEDTDDDD